MTGLSLPHRLWRLLPASARREAALRAISMIAPRPDAAPPPASDAVAVGGEIGRASGLGEGARIMIEAIAGLGIAVRGVEACVVAQAERAEVACIDRRPGLRHRNEALILHVNPPVLPLAALTLGRHAMHGRRVIGYWAWELPVAPPSWRAGARYVHSVWVPSRFTADALEALAPGLVRVVPHPLAACPPRPSGLGRADFGLPDDAIVVLVSFSLASSFARKNPLAAIEAARLAFGNRMDRILLLKIAKPEHAPGDMRTIMDAVAARPNVVIETRTLPTADSHALTRMADIVLSLHRSEGFGLVPAEAMMLGRPVIATDWSGTTDFLDASCGVPVDYRLVPARDPRGVFEAPGAVWADADIGQAAARLAALADDAHARAALGAAARARAATAFGTAPLEAALREAGITATAA